MRRENKVNKDCGAVYICGGLSAASLQSLCKTKSWDEVDYVRSNTKIAKSLIKNKILTKWLRKFPSFILIFLMMALFIGAQCSFMNMQCQ